MAVGRVNLYPGGLPAGFRRVQVRKKSYSHVLPLCGALIIDVTAAISSVCMDIASRVLFSPGAIAVFLQGFIFMSQSTSVFRRNGLLLNSFLLLTIAVR